MVFIKGNIPWNIKRKEIKICLSCKTTFSVRKYRILTAKYCSYSCRNNAYIGRKNSAIARKKISDANKGKKFTLGRIMPIQERRMRAKLTAGEKNWNWQGGKTPKAKRIRNSSEYTLWRTSVYMRDDYTCQLCGDKGGKLNADHIKPFAYYPELRFAIDNGRTLCIECHKQTDTFGWKAFNTYRRGDNINA